MKRTLGLLLVLLMVISLGMANAQTYGAWNDNIYSAGTSLTSIGNFTKEDRIIEGNSSDLFAQDGYGNQYSSLIYSNTCEGMIEYRLGGNYKTLNATVYIPAFALQNGHDHQWNTASISIYADNQYLGCVSGFSAYDAPLPIRVNVENVQFLRFEFNNVCYYYHGMEYALAVIGNAMLS
ncbi:MAG: hypothetical protein II995_04900 [Oscillospiraceae bacterium]|nr:hypothetical protein [Oscillospiraceae bacterium]